MKYNEQLLADITRAMYQHSGVMCDATYRIEVAKLLVDSLEGEETPNDVEEITGHILPTETWDGYEVVMTDCADVWDIEVFCTTNNADKTLVGRSFVADDDMANLRYRITRNKGYTPESYLTQVVKAISWYMKARANDERDVAKWNEYARYTYGGATIYSNLSELAREMYAENPVELARAMFFGDLKGWNDYVYINGYGNICSIEDLGEYISYDNLALWLYSQNRVALKVNVQVGEPGEETWDVVVKGDSVSLEDIIERVKHELYYEIEVGDVTLDPATWLIDIDVLGIE